MWQRQAWLCLAIVAVVAGCDESEPRTRAAGERADVQSAPYRFRSMLDGAGVGGFAALNPRHGLRAELSTQGLALSSSATHAVGWELTLQTRTFGRAGRSVALPPGEPSLVGGRVEHARGPLVEWFSNDERGLEHGFTVPARPAGAGAELELMLSFSGTLTPRLRGGDVQLLDRNETPILGYQDLRAWDAAGKELAARFELRGCEGGSCQLAVLVDDADAAYPVTIDPLLVALLAKLPATFWEGFGAPTALSGDTGVVGSPRDSEAAWQAGSVTVFERNLGGANAWGARRKLVAPDPGFDLRFGSAVAASGDLIAVGAERANGNAGVVYVFGRDAGGADN